MPNKILNFSGFSKIFEGGSAIKTSRRIREDEFTPTMESIKNLLFPLLGINPSSDGINYMVIGSIGKKESPSDTSGDLDIGYNGNWFSQKESVGYKECAKRIYDILDAEIEPVLGYKPEMKLMSGLNIVSIGWPIGGDQGNGTVQLDLIPLSDMNWARFIYYSPDYKRGESKYKSAHRNWLLSAILSARAEVINTDDEGQIMDYEAPVLILSDGLFWHTKSYRGKIKARLKSASKIPGSERFVTNDPQEFIEFVLGPGYEPGDVKSFEDLFKIMISPDFELSDKLPHIKEKFLEYLNRVGLPVPSEINTI
jgi:hypothetical protein